MSARSSEHPGMTARRARTIEYCIIGFCLIALLLIFQPFSQVMFGIGAVMVVLGGLAFNLVPQCVPGKPLRSVVKTGLVVLVVFAVVVALALASAKLYGIYFVK